ncbi:MULTISPECIES: hypothetical protein [Serratia]|uniref:hypothetical protein n=1 Tax=Serratia TaxID=613 RepID=UPI0011B99D7E|nr:MULTISPECIES: hypothetical protein [Serratia]TWY25337.1 hypothetical protein FR965_26920 [Serratia marcescens]
MTISKILLFVLCLGSALGGAVVTGVVISTGNDCTLTKPESQKGAEAKFWSGQSTRGGAKGY